MDIREQFIMFHDEMLSALGKAYDTGDISTVTASLYETYHGYFGMPGSDKAQFYEADGAIEGILQTGQAMPGVRQECTNRHVQMSSDNEAVVFYEKSMHYQTGVARAFVLEVWRSFTRLLEDHQRGRGNYQVTNDVGREIPCGGEAL